MSFEAIKISAHCASIGGVGGTFSVVRCYLFRKGGPKRRDFVERQVAKGKKRKAMRKKTGGAATKCRKSKYPYFERRANGGRARKEPDHNQSELNATERKERVTKSGAPVCTAPNPKGGITLSRYSKRRTTIER